MAKRKRYTEEFKRVAVRLLVTRGETPAREIARSLGVTGSQLYQWRGPSLQGYDTARRSAGAAKRPRAARVHGRRSKPALGRRPDLRGDLVGLRLRRIRYRCLLTKHRWVARIELAAQVLRLMHSSKPCTQGRTLTASCITVTAAFPFMEFGVDARLQRLLRLREVRRILPFVAVMLVYAFTPGLCELAEVAIHYVEAGDLHGSDEERHAEHGELPGEDGDCHTCFCHAPTAFVIALQTKPKGLAILAQKASSFTLTEGASDGATSELFRPPIA